MKVPSRTDPVSVVKRCCVPLLLAVGWVVPAIAPGTAAAQSLGDVDARLSRVERVLDQSLLEQLQRIDGLQRELRELRGDIESLTNEVQTLQRRNQNLYADTDFRLTELEDLAESGNAFGVLPQDGAALPGSGPLTDSALTDGALTDGALTEEGLGAPGASDGPTAGAGAAAGTASRGVFVSERSPGSTATTPVRTAATQAEKAAYTRAYDLLARGQNGAAVREFDAFLDEYPAGPYSFNAWYWKGEAMYAERRFDEAIDNFRQVTDQFPTSTKVPDAQLKIGFSLYEQGQYDQARQILERVRDDFQGRSAAVLARKRLQKMDREGL